MFSLPRRVVLKALALLLLLWQWCTLQSCSLEPSVSFAKYFPRPLADGTLVAATHSLDTIPLPTSQPIPLEENVDTVTAANTERPNLQTVLESEAHDATPQLQCRAPSEERYAHLRSFATRKPRFFFALDLYQAAGILPRLLASILETIKFLGPESCFLSIVQGNSTDGTLEMLQTLRKDAAALGLDFSLVRSDMDSRNATTDRIETLSALRNLALAPLLNNASRFSSSSSSAEETTILFLNDISACAADMLELLHQRRVQGAAMACPMDLSDDGLFYDVWVARSMTGDLFFHIPPSGLWSRARDLLWDDPARKRRLRARLPFQAFACWNGMAAIGATPFLERGVRFRRSAPGECYMGEPTLLCKDLWREGFGKVLVVPSVWVAYSRAASVKVKREEGFVDENVEGGRRRGRVGKDDEEGGDDNDDDGEGLQELVEWEAEPPPRIKCPVPSFADPQWVPPYEGFVDIHSEEKEEDYLDWG
ncbi:MAG: hypothetical protein LQ344_006941 [Seirophora lacunosa]|nr:MAG: hypothetical protein LQ344_006941 [Seirophora lacunosa]